MCTRFLLLIISASFAVGITSCRVREQDKVIPIGPDVKADLVIYFKAGASHDQIEAFSNEVLSTRVNKGMWPRPGISMILRLLPLQEHEGIAVSFFPDATQTQRDEIKQAVRSSQIVYRVLENVSPSSIKRLD